MLSKPDMWESEEFRMKFSKIPRHLQGKFLRGIQELYRQESDSMLDFIRQSRTSLRLTATEIKDEQQVLQQTLRKLAEGRGKNTIDVGKNPDPRREKSNLSTRSYPPQPRKHKPYCPSPEPMSHPGYPRPMDRLPALTGANRTTMHFENEEAFDLEDDEDFIKEETEEIMRATSRANNFHEIERARQLEKIEQLKQQRKGKKEAHQEVAHEMIREASTVEKRKTDEKRKQEMKVREKLEEKKRQREMTGLGGGRMSSASIMTDVDVNTDIVRTPRPRMPANLESCPPPPDDPLPSPPLEAGADPGDDSNGKKDKKKKKDKKDKKEKKEKKEKKKKNKEAALEELAV